MCGIGFISPNPESGLDVREITRALLHQLAPRGRDAAGVAWKRPDGSTLYRKVHGHPVRLAAELATVSGSRSLDTSEAIIVHTRWGTVGSPKVMENNHPVIRPGVALVHNGTVSNTAALYRTAKAKARAEVDTDALAALIERAPDRPTLHKWFRRMEGLAAIAWLDVTDDPRDRGTVHAARLDTRPLVLGTTTGGDVIGASTLEALHRVSEQTGVTFARLHDLPEGASVTLERGEVTLAVNIGTGRGVRENAAEYETASKVSA